MESSIDIRELFWVPSGVMWRRKGSGLLDMFQLEHSTLVQVAELQEFKGRWSCVVNAMPQSRLTELGARATVESVGASTRMDGARLTDAQVESFLFGPDPRPPSTRDEMAVAGYADALEMVYDSVGSGQLDTAFIKQLHGVVTWYTGNAGIGRGQYRTSEQRIRAFDAGGRPAGSLFEAAPPDRIPELMEALVSWTSTSLHQKEYHPLLVCSAFVIHLHVIHPFREGSGRLSRLMATWLLLRTGYAYVPFLSLERILEESRSRYLRALSYSSGLITGDPGGLSDFVHFFLRTLAAQKEELQRKIKVQDRDEILPELSNQLLELARDGGRLTMSAAIRATGANRNTIKVHLRKLVTQGRLQRHGGGRGTWYLPA